MASFYELQRPLYSQEEWVGLGEFSQEEAKPFRLVDLPSGKRLHDSGSFSIAMLVSQRVWDITSSMKGIDVVRIPWKKHCITLPIYLPLMVPLWKRLL